MFHKIEKEIDMLQRHLEVLQRITENQPMGIVTLSNETGYAHHKVRYSLRMLEKKDLIESSPRRAVATGRANPYLKRIDRRIDDIATTIRNMEGDM